MVGIIGDPVGHSLSPVIHNAAFQALDLDWVYVAFPVRAGEGAQAATAMRTLGLSGLSVTMPHKAAMVGQLDRLGPVAARLGVVNTLSWAGPVQGGVLVGDSTDGPGFLEALVEDEGFEPAGRGVLVLGGRWSGTGRDPGPRGRRRPIRRGGRPHGGRPQSLALRWPGNGVGPSHRATSKPSEGSCRRRSSS